MPQRLAWRGDDHCQPPAVLFHLLEEGRRRSQPWRRRERKADGNRGAPFWQRREMLLINRVPRAAGYGAGGALNSTTPTAAGMDAPEHPGPLLGRGISVSWGQGHPGSRVPQLLAPHNFPGLRLRRRRASFKGSAAI